VRPGFTGTAEITTARKSIVVAVPIQALTVREMLFNDKGDLVHEPPPKKGRNVEPTVSASNEPPPGHTRKETEGVFVIRDGRAVFAPVKIGIAGEKYFEVVSGVKTGDQVITGRSPTSARWPTARESGSTRTTTTARRDRRTADVLDATDPGLGPDRHSGDLGQQARSLLTVLGNIVAVTSIVTVVSLIQGMNSYVSNAIVSDVGADSFTSSGCRRSAPEEDEERVRANPADHPVGRPGRSSASATTSPR
jgi:hypothetical protein